MALKKKVKDEEKVVQQEEVSTPVESNESESMITPEESEALESQIEDEKEAGASTKRLEVATMLVSNKFNLDDSYRVTSFADKGKSLKLTLENKEFILSIDIKDTEHQGL